MEEAHEVAHEEAFDLFDATGGVRFGQSLRVWRGCFEWKLVEQKLVQPMALCLRETGEVLCVDERMHDALEELLELAEHLLDVRVVELDVAALDVIYPLIWERNRRQDHERAFLIVVKERQPATDRRVAVVAKAEGQFAVSRELVHVRHVPRRRVLVYVRRSHEDLAQCKRVTVGKGILQSEILIRRIATARKLDPLEEVSQVTGGSAFRSDYMRKLTGQIRLDRQTLATGEFKAST